MPKKAKRSVIVSNPTIMTTSGTQSVVGERAATGVSGIDEMIEGGFPRGSMILLLGGPGTGKTILSAKYLHNGLASGEPGVYASFAEDQKTFFSNMGRIGLDFDRYVRDQSFRFLDLLTTTEAGIPVSIREIIDQVEASKAKRLVVDSLSVLNQAYRNPGEARILLHTILSKTIRSRGVTALLIAEAPGFEKGAGMEGYVTDGIITLAQEWKHSQLMRSFRILKMRGTRLNAAERRYGIKKGGLIVYPEPTLNVENLAPGEKRESSGIVEFDKMLGGGFLERSWTVIAGTSGTGKTSVALHFLKEGHNRGEKSVYISYEETPEQLTRHASGFGWTLQPSVDKGGLKLLSFDVEQLNLDDHLFELCTMLESFKPARLVVDSIDPVKRMLSEDDFIRFVKNLITVTRRVGTTVMLTAFAKPTDVWVAGPDVSSVVDNMISLRDVEISSVLKRSLVVFKERGTKHDRGIREFEITNRGVIIKEKFKGVEQVLTGLPRRALTPTSSTHF